MHKFVRVLDLKYGLLCQELEANKLNETNSYPNIQRAKYQKNRKLISPHAVCKGTRTAIKSKNVHAYKIT